MQTVLDAISRKGKHFARHPFLQRLERPGPFADVIAFGPGLTFWAMAFQDVLRINERLVQDPLVREVAAQHRYEDSGHDDWFLHDMIMLGQLRDVRWVFSGEHAATRDMAYSLISEVYRTDSDYVRMALLLVLETTGSAFFTRIASYVERTGFAGQLAYLSRSHLQAEADHEIWEAQVQARLAEINLSATERAECLAMIDRAFPAFERLLDHLEALADAGVSMPIGPVQGRTQHARA